MQADTCDWPCVQDSGYGCQPICSRVPRCREEAELCQHLTPTASFHLDFSPSTEKVVILPSGCLVLW